MLQLRMPVAHKRKAFPHIPLRRAHARANFHSYLPLPAVARSGAQDQPEVESRVALSLEYCASLHLADFPRPTPKPPRPKFSGRGLRVATYNFKYAPHPHTISRLHLATSLALLLHRAPDQARMDNTNDEDALIEMATDPKRPVAVHRQTEFLSQPPPPATKTVPRADQWLSTVTKIRYHKLSKSEQPRTLRPDFVAVA
eukprot:2897427-Rhodomonas_salina.2